MFPLIIKVERKDLLNGLTKKRVGEIVAKGTEAMAKEWKNNMLPIHFTEKGAKIYKYAKRQGQHGRKVKHPRRKRKDGTWVANEWITLKNGKRIKRRSYLERKNREKGHMRPLVFSGDSEQAAGSATLRPVGRGEKRGVKVILNAPNLNWLRKSLDGTVINMRSEVTRFTKDEVNRLMRIFNRKAMKELGMKRKRTVKVFGISR
jgi:hypothetical protein